MKLFLTLLVRDEVDIVRENLEFHLAQGVDRVLVTDNNSVDGTLEILREYEARGAVQLLLEPSNDWMQAKWVTRMARLAAKEGADWVINSDVDEFWFPRTGTLRSSFDGIGDEVGTVVAHRTDFVPRPEDGRVFWERMTLRERESFNSVGRTLPPKVAHRAHPKISVGNGNHDVTGAELGERLEERLVDIVHFPIRTWAQFENKVVRGGRGLARNRELSQGAYRTWRRTYDLWERGELRDYYERKLVADEKREDVFEDTRVRDFLRSLHRAKPADRT